MILLAIMMLLLGSVEAGICGNRGQCRCSATGDIICNEVEGAPFFKITLRHGNRLTIRTDNNFDIDTLRITEGFDRVLVIGPSLERCKSAEYDYPWVSCTTETGSYRPTDGQLKTTKETSTWKSTQETSMAAEGSSRPATGDETTMGRGVKDQEKGMGRGVLGLIIWNAVWGAAGLIMTCCILVSIVNLHERINLYTACNDNPMFAVHCCHVLTALALAPFYCCGDFCKRRCPSCCIRTVDACTRGSDPADNVPYEMMWHA